MFSIGVDIGGSKIAAGIVDSEMKLVAKKSLPFPHTGEPMDSIDVIKTLIDTLVQENGLSIADAVCIGLAVPGSIDYAKQAVIDAHNLDYHGFPLGDHVRALYPGCAVLVENDANAAALAEYFCGAFRGCSSGLLITIGTGIGGGLVQDGQIFIGGMKNGFEFGHATLVFGGEKCTCGNPGCIESYCSAAALVREGRKLASAHHESALYTRAQGDLMKINAKLVRTARGKATSRPFSSTICTRNIWAPQSARRLRCSTPKSSRSAGESATTGSSCLRRSAHTRRSTRSSSTTQRSFRPNCITTRAS